MAGDKQERAESENRSAEKLPTVDPQRDSVAHPGRRLSGAAVMIGVLVAAAGAVAITILVVNSNRQEANQEPIVRKDPAAQQSPANAATNITDPAPSRAGDRLAQLRGQVDRARAREELARADAEQTFRSIFEKVKQDRAALQARLLASLSGILETRSEARGMVVTLADVLFDTDKASLTPDARERLSKLAGILMAYPDPFQLEIEGHTDSTGSQDYNQQLSEERAQSVRDYLVQAGLAADKIVAVRGFGKTKPIASNDTPEGRQVNRRVEIVVSDAK